ncbi:MAG TPA: SDR family oxidoreductase [Candidatus Baltobacteraceae bacterium]|nr:SDR family oxidoreductase [Candidatus Baltobacteraceae bacterium]
MNPLDCFSLQGKVVVLTGGAGLYGRGLASFLARAGATLVLAARDQKALAAVAAEENQQGHTVEAEAYDQGEEKSVLALCDRVLARHGRVDGLVNNAVARPMAGMDDPLDRWEASMRVNATGLFAMLRAFGSTMAKNGRGSIVNIGSIQGMVGANLWLYEGTRHGTIPDYFFHKGGMLNLTRYFAAILGPRGVRVNCVSPGGFFADQDPVLVKRYEQMTMLGRMAGPQDLGGAVVFLLSDAAAYVTGANLAVDGGYTAK